VSKNRRNVDSSACLAFLPFRPARHDGCSSLFTAARFERRLHFAAFASDFADIDGVRDYGPASWALHTVERAIFAACLAMAFSERRIRGAEA